MIRRFTTLVLLTCIPIFAITLKQAKYLALKNAAFGYIIKYTFAF